MKARYAQIKDWLREHRRIRLAFAFARGGAGGMFVALGPEPWTWLLVAVWTTWLAVQLWRLRTDSRELDRLVANDVDRYLAWVIEHHNRDASGFCTSCAPAQMFPCEHRRAANAIMGMPNKRKAEFFFEVICPTIEAFRDQYPELFSGHEQPET